MTTGCVAYLLVADSDKPLVLQQKSNLVMEI